MTVGIHFAAEENKEDIFYDRKRQLDRYNTLLFKQKTN
jgi:hypothetical protein